MQAASEGEDTPLPLYKIHFLPPHGAQQSAGREAGPGGENPEYCDVGILRNIFIISAAGSTAGPGPGL